jgi:hypothetical protein
MAAFMDVQLLNVGIIVALKRWGASHNICSVRLTMIPGAYCYFNFFWARPRDQKRATFLFDGHRAAARCRNQWLGFKIACRKLGLR